MSCGILNGILKETKKKSRENQRKNKVRTSGNSHVSLFQKLLYSKGNNKYSKGAFDKTHYYFSNGLITRVQQSNSKVSTTTTTTKQPIWSKNG